MNRNWRQNISLLYETHISSAFSTLLQGDRTNVTSIVLQNANCSVTMTWHQTQDYEKFFLARVCIPETFCSEHKNRHSHWHHMVPMLPICKSNDPLFPSIPSPFWQSLSVVCSCPPILHARQCWNGDKQTRLSCFGSWSNLYGHWSCSCGCWIGFEI